MEANKNVVPMQRVSIEFTNEQLNTILRHLDRGIHGEVRQVIDHIALSVTKQQAAAKAPACGEVAANE